MQLSEMTPAMWRMDRNGPMLRQSEFSTYRSYRQGESFQRGASGLMLGERTNTIPEREDWLWNAASEGLQDALYRASAPVDCLSPEYAMLLLLNHGRMALNQSQFFRDIELQYISDTH